MITAFDVDLDLPPSFKPEVLFPDWVRASVCQNEELRPHACGVYPQSMALDKVTGLAAIPYEEAEQLGYLKLDLLHLTVYKHFQSRDEITELLKIEPEWTILQSPSQVAKLFQLSRHIDLLQKVKPRSIEDVADALALIRPGKIELLPLYLKDKFNSRPLLYKKGSDGYSFKKSHAISYAMVVVLQLHLINLELL